MTSMMHDLIEKMKSETQLIKSIGGDKLIRESFENDEIAGEFKKTLSEYINFVLKQQSINDESSRVFYSIQLGKKESKLKDTLFTKFSDETIKPTFKLLISTRGKEFGIEIVKIHFKGNEFSEEDIVLLPMEQTGGGAPKQTQYAISVKIDYFKESILPSSESTEESTEESKKESTEESKQKGGRKSNKRRISKNNVNYRRNRINKLLNNGY